VQNSFLKVLLRSQHSRKGCFGITTRIVNSDRIQDWNPNRIHVLYQKIKSPSRMANFTPLCGNACLQSPTGERGEATKREVLFVATDCAGERARLWVAERAQTPFQTPYLDSVLIPNSCPQNCSHEHLEPEIESHDVNCLHTSIPKVIISWITANHFPNHHKIPCPL